MHSPPTVLFRAWKPGSDRLRGFSPEMNRAYILWLAATLGLLACTPLWGQTHAVERELRPGVIRRMIVSPANPVVGDRVVVSAWIINRSAEKFVVYRGCAHTDNYFARLPEYVLPPERPASPPDSTVLLLEGIQCLGYAIHPVLPGEDFQLSRYESGALLAPGEFRISVKLYYGTFDSAEVTIRVRDPA